MFHRRLARQLMTPWKFQEGLLVRLQTKKNHVTDLKSALKTMLIGLVFHAGSGHVKIVLQNVKNLMLVTKNHVNYLNW